MQPLQRVCRALVSAVAAGDGVQTLPVFAMAGESVQVLTTPKDFYVLLKRNILAAQQHISLSALYLGSVEEDLVGAITTALTINPQLQCTILIDFLRGTRGDTVLNDKRYGKNSYINLSASSDRTSSVSALAPLLAAFPDRFHLALYHTPELRGWKKKLLPARYNEGIGLLHFKIFATDHCTILSGANLSHDYFTDRQDRYIAIHDINTTQYFHSLVDTCSTLAYRATMIDNIDHSHVLLKSPIDPIPDPIQCPKRYKQVACEILTEFTRQATLTQSMTTPSLVLSNDQMKSDLKSLSNDTMLVPLLQCFPLGICDEERAMKRLWRALDVLTQEYQSKQERIAWNVYFTSGYFNATQVMQQTLLNFAQKGGNVSLLTASPQANGFFNSKGVSRFIPAAYTYLEHRFFRRVQQLQRPSTDTTKVDQKTAPGAVQLLEYVRYKWTYHAKGIWLCPPLLLSMSTLSPSQEQIVEQQPIATVIGSSNFGQRSARRDLECQALLVSSNAQLREQLHGERQALWQYGEIVTRETFARPERRVAWCIRLGVRSLKSMF